jgi:hypothetical protein
MNLSPELKAKNTLKYYSALCNISNHINLDVLKNRLSVLDIELKYDKKEAYYNDLNKSYQYNDLQLYPICKKSKLSVYNVKSDFYKNELTFKTQKANEFNLLKNNYFVVIAGNIANL